jgi:acetyltransferase-like isoleucine patch superfamily enzyme
MLRVALAYLRARWQLRRARIGARVMVLGRVWLHGDGHVEIGDDVVFDGRLCAIELHTGPEGRIVVGAGTHIGGGSSLEAQMSVAIGARCGLGRYCKIMDNNFHPLRGDRHECPASSPVILENDVSIGDRAIILAGSHIGRGARLHAGTVLSKRVAAETDVGGNPARQFAP